MKVTRMSHGEVQAKMSSDDKNSKPNKKKPAPKMGKVSKGGMGKNAC